MLNYDNIKIGSRVFWNDPDGGLCSGWGRVVAIHGFDEADFEMTDNTVLALQKDDGGEVEVLVHELGEP